MWSGWMLVVDEIGIGWDRKSVMGVTLEWIGNVGYLFGRMYGLVWKE